MIYFGVCIYDLLINVLIIHIYAFIYCFCYLLYLLCATCLALASMYKNKFNYFFIIYFISLILQNTFSFSRFHIFPVC